MNKLLCANFTRLKKDKMFWTGLIFMAAFGALLAGFCWFRQTQTGYDTELSRLLFICSVVIGFIAAAFCSLFLGTEYSDGTIRNKLVVGHSRSNIYLSSLITCAAACTIMLLAYWATISVLGIPLLGWPQMGVTALLALAGIVLLLTFACTAIFTLVAMLNQNKAVVAIICIIGFITLLFAAVWFNARLEEPPIYDSYVYMDNTGNIATDQAEPNPNYVEGTMREVYQFILDFLPTGQALLVCTMAAVHPLQMALYSLLIIIITTCCGLLFFRRKDIK